MRLVFVCGSAIRLPASMVTVASAAAAGAQTEARSPTPSKYTRKRAMKPAAFGATLSHATNDVGPASYASGTHMWNGNAAILNAKPARAAISPSVSSGEAGARAMAASDVLPVAPYTNDSPYAMIAEE